MSSAGADVLNVPQTEWSCGKVLRGGGGLYSVFYVICRERRGEERRGKERKGKERKGKERKGKERKGKYFSQMTQLACWWPAAAFPEGNSGSARDVSKILY